MGRVYASLKQNPSGDFTLDTSYNQAFVSALKASIPTSERRWDPVSKVWLIDPRSAGIASGLVTQYLGVQCPVQSRVTVATLPPETKLLKVEYIGAAKDRGGSEPVSYGYCEGNWNVALPLSVLKAWFSPGLEAQERPGEKQTLYSALGVAKTADATELKRAFRRLARQWHPDVCKEPDAAEQFMAIKAAYDTLSDSQARKKYDLGLAMEAQVRGGSPRAPDKASFWRSPLRCGWLLVEALEKLGRHHVQKILQWEDITDNRGRTMVSSWPMGASTFEVNWI